MPQDFSELNRGIRNFGESIASGITARASRKREEEKAEEEEEKAKRKRDLDRTIFKARQGRPPDPDEDAAIEGDRGVDYAIGMAREKETAAANAKAAKEAEQKKTADDAKIAQEQSVARNAMMGGANVQGPMNPQQQMQAQNFTEMAAGDQLGFLQRQEPPKPDEKLAARIQAAKRITDPTTKRLYLTGQITEEQAGVLPEKAEKPKDNTTDNRGAFVADETKNLDSIEAKSQRWHDAVNALGITMDMLNPDYPVNTGTAERPFMEPQGQSGVDRINKQIEDRAEKLRVEGVRAINAEKYRKFPPQSSDDQFNDLMEQMMEEAKSLQEDIEDAMKERRELQGR